MSSGNDYPHSHSRNSDEVDDEVQFQDTNHEDERVVDPPDTNVLVELGAEDFPTYFLERDGRLFPSNESSPYPLPIDTPEQERANVQHGILHRLIGANYIGPVREILALEPGRQKLVVDLCTGTGKWVIDMAREFPHVQFRGLDIVPIATRYPPPNVRFEIHDVNTPLRWADNSVDFIHARSISMAVRDYPVVLREVARVLRPGGLFFSGEWGRYAAFHSVFGLDPAIRAPASFHFYEALTNALRNCRGIEPIAQFIPGFLSTSGLFTQIFGQHFAMPIGPWHDDPQYKSIGKAFRAAHRRYADSVSSLLTEAGEDAGQIVAEYVDELRRVPGLVSLYHTVHARKPLG
ncbi:S-adenosyl-L-methionine-dependent methyltransferase [Crucibulum laeve]|uniref:S-adenosyl-L-methionine-dependent methyltransferase n=1 Tax=Crucibulum laeve TaxID=68775 RepID=A0A5C3LTJ5_9AGAR|nr:S-adenosyl-L-methionine-dependent methyltransferase [Crucibulum laeve]